MTNNPWKQIFDRIGEAAAWEQLAEEADEVAQAAMKCARIIRGENPARMTYEEARQKIREELADFDNSLDVINAGLAKPGETIATPFNLQKYDKMTRWYQHLFGKEEPNE
jgi:hypothetical protein